MAHGGSLGAEKGCAFSRQRELFFLKPGFCFFLPASENWMCWLAEPHRISRVLPTGRIWAPKARNASLTRTGSRRSRGRVVCPVLFLDNATSVAPPLLLAEPHQPNVIRVERTPPRRWVKRPLLLASGQGWAAKLHRFQQSPTEQQQAPRLKASVPSDHARRATALCFTYGRTSLRR